MCYKILSLDNINLKNLKKSNSNYIYSNDIINPDSILVRSQSLHDYKLNENLLSIVRVGTGTNNIPIDICNEKGIVVFNTPGANANAVKELTIACLILSSRKIINSIKWTNSLKNSQNLSATIEKEKSMFKGNEIKNKKLGIIGLGSIGRLVANDAISLGMDVYGFDPFLSIDSAWELSRYVIRAKSIDEIYKNCDYISLHIPYSESNKEMINSKSILKMKKGVHIINLSRAEIVNNEDIIEAVKRKIVSTYITDFPKSELIENNNIICIPHLGASTFESTSTCTNIAIKELNDFLKNGNITNSINLPDISMERVGDSRICVFHKNIPNMISTISTQLSSKNINIESMQCKSKKNYAYAILDITGNLIQEEINFLYSIDGIIKIRIIKNSHL